MRRAAAAAVIAVLLAACSSFDPKTGAPVPLQCTGTDSDPTTDVDFHRDIRPIMDRLPNDAAGPGCKACHYRGTGTQQGIQLGKLDMTTLGDLRKGGTTSGANIVNVQHPCDSAIVQKLLGVYSPAPTQMPKNAPRSLNAQEIQLFIDWIAEGAKGMDDE